MRRIFHAFDDIHFRHKGLPRQIAECGGKSRPGDRKADQH